MRTPANASETKQTLLVLKAELKICLQLYALAKSSTKLENLSPKWRKRLKCFCGDTFQRLIYDLNEDIELLELEQDVCDGQT